MRIGIDICQCIYEGTGVGEYTIRLVEKLLDVDRKNEYVLFFSHYSQSSTCLRRQEFKAQISKQCQMSNVKCKIFRIPIPILEFLWNRLHIIPIEWLIGDIDVFLTSDWLEPPTLHAKKVTTIHDLSVLKFPDSYDEKIKSVHIRKLKWVKKESSMIICDSEATKKDAMELLGIEEERLKVVYLGV